MSFLSTKVKSYKEVLKMGKEKVSEALAPIRARAASSRANLKVAEIEEKMVNLEEEIHTLCAEEKLDFDKIINKIDEYDLSERKLEQVNKLVKELFPEGK